MVDLQRSSRKIRLLLDLRGVLLERFLNALVDLFSPVLVGADLCGAVHPPNQLIGRGVDHVNDENAFSVVRGAGVAVPVGTPFSQLP